ncbi:MAG: 50S ribosomal protein L9 [Actinobacteria bacterium]|nr:50S ribosomal protein L9 [Actinomycetota bacterium]
MKVILTNNTAGLGDAGDVVEVKPGYARNFLFPRNLAVLWTKGGANQVSAIRRARTERAIRSKDHAQEVAAWLKANKVTIKTRVGESGKLFGSIGASDIVEAIYRVGGDKLDKRIVQLQHPIKLSGTHKVPLKLQHDIVGYVNIEIVAG